MECHDVWNAWRNDVLKINEIVSHVFRMHVLWCMNMKYLLKCIFASENKSLTSVRDLWEFKSWNTVGDEDYAHLQTLFGMFPLGIPVFVFLGEIRWGRLDLAWEIYGECWFMLEGKSSGILVVRCSSGELYSWLERMKANNSLGIKKLTVIWSDSRLYITGDGGKLYWRGGVLSIDF